MSERDPLLEGPPSAKEIEGARLLAEALESGTAECADPHALSVVRLLDSLIEKQAGEDFAKVRARRELVARASRIRLLRIAVRFAAAAALVLATLSIVQLRRSPGRPASQILAQREAAARAAVAALAAPGTQDLMDARLRSQVDDLRSERFASAIQSERLAALLDRTDEKSSMKDRRGKSQPSTLTQEPGGAS